MHLAKKGDVHWLGIYLEWFDLGYHDPHQFPMQARPAWFLRDGALAGEAFPYRFWSMSGYCCVYKNCKSMSPLVYQWTLDAAGLQFMS